MASTTALLATSQSPSDAGVVPTEAMATYEFERRVEGESVELTSEQPSVLFLITVRATSLGPNGATSTLQATADLTGTVITTGATGNPLVSVDVGNGQRVEDIQESFSTKRPLPFEGSCDAPAENAPCQASFSVQLTREDDGTQGGIVEVSWSFLLESHGVVAAEKNDQSGLDPPWTVEIVRP